MWIHMRHGWNETRMASVFDYSLNPRVSSLPQTPILGWCRLKSWENHDEICSRQIHQRACPMLWSRTTDVMDMSTDSQFITLATQNKTDQKFRTEISQFYCLFNQIYIWRRCMACWSNVCSLRQITIYEFKSLLSSHSKGTRPRKDVIPAYCQHCLFLCLLMCFQNVTVIKK